MAAQKVLIIDDSKLMRLQVREMLPGNMEIVEAVDGADGFEKAHQEQPNLIILDCFMPKMNGWQVVHKLLSYPDLQKIPIVLMSGREEDVHENAGELFEYFEFLAKPFDKVKLITAIKASLAKTKQRNLQAAAGAASPASAPDSAPAPSAQFSHPHPPSSQEKSQETATMAASVALDAATLLQRLQSDVRELRQHNAEMRAEMQQLKQQMAQMAKVVRQNLSRV
ncbi:MAG: response regulator [Synechococcales cyanobacterium RM1_1_8]|nr:response regulator [Synechococcales cyanobacterium RM1_1_8]